MKVKRESEVTKSCPTLSDPMDYSSPGSFVHGFSRQEDYREFKKQSVFTAEKVGHHSFSYFRLITHTLGSVFRSIGLALALPPELPALCEFMMG